MPPVRFTKLKRMQRGWRLPRYTYYIDGQVTDKKEWYSRWRKQRKALKYKMRQDWEFSG